MIDAARRAHIRRLFYVEHWKVGAISAHLGVHRNTVHRAIAPDRLVSAGSPIQPTMLDRDRGLVGQTREPHACDPQPLARFEVTP